MRRLDDAAVYCSLSSAFRSSCDSFQVTLFFSDSLFLSFPSQYFVMPWTRQKHLYWQGCLRSLPWICSFFPYMSHVYKCCPWGEFYASSSSSIINSVSRATWWPKKDDREKFCSVLTSCFNKNCRCLQIYNHISSTNLFTMSHYNHYIKRKKRDLFDPGRPACLIISWPYTNAGAWQACGLWDRKASKQTA